MITFICDIDARYFPEMWYVPRQKYYEIIRVFITSKEEVK